MRTSVDGTAVKISTDYGMLTQKGYFCGIPNRHTAT